MGRILIALSLIASMNFSGQKMLQIFKQKVNFVMYASFLFFVLSLSGCSTIGQIAQGAGQGLQQASQNNTTVHCYSSNYGYSTYTRCN